MGNISFWEKLLERTLKEMCDAALPHFLQLPNMQFVLWWLWCKQLKHNLKFFTWLQRAFENHCKQICYMISLAKSTNMSRNFFRLYYWELYLEDLLTEPYTFPKYQLDFEKNVRNLEVKKMTDRKTPCPSLLLNQNLTFQVCK